MCCTTATILHMPYIYLCCHFWHQANIYYIHFVCVYCVATCDVPSATQHSVIILLSVESQYNISYVSSMIKGWVFLHA